MKLHFKSRPSKTPESDALHRAVRSAIRRLESRFDGIESCLVEVNLPQPSPARRSLHEIRVEVGIRGSTIRAARPPSGDGKNRDRFTLLDELFSEIERKLENRTKPRESLRGGPRIERTWIGVPGLPRPVIRRRPVVGPTPTIGV